MRLSFIAVVTDQQFRNLLIVRNECRDGLTHDTHELTLADQKKWRSLCWPGQRYIPDEIGFGSWIEKTIWYEPYLLYDEDWPTGYGLLKWDGKKYWMTAGIVKAYRGKGLSQFLINYITEMGHRNGAEVWIDVMDSNPALFGDIRVGYEFVEHDAPKHDTIKGLHVMKHNRKRRLGSAEARWMEEHGKPVKEEIDIVQEMIEVDKISRDVGIVQR